MCEAMKPWHIMITPQSFADRRSLMIGMKGHPRTARGEAFMLSSRCVAS